MLVSNYILTVKHDIEQQTITIHHFERDRSLPPSLKQQSFQNLKGGGREI